MKFRDRGEAGDVLADRIMKGGLTNGNNSVVLGIPRGGIILADIVAGRLGAGFDIVIPRKLTAPDNKELAIGAVMSDGTSYVNQYLVTALKVSPDYIEHEKAKQASEIQRRTSLYRKPGLDYNLEGKNIILVDDGVATGSTIIAASRWIKKQRPTRVTVAVPVAPSSTVAMLEQEADAAIVVLVPKEFGSVGQFYQEFNQVTDEQVIQIMKSRKLI